MLPLKTPVPPQNLGSERRGWFLSGRDANESRQRSNFGYRRAGSQGMHLPPVHATNLQEVGFPFPQFGCTENRCLHGSVLSKLSLESMEGVSCSHKPTSGISGGWGADLASD